MTQSIPLKDLPTIPRSKLEVAKAGESVITQISVSQNNPLQIERFTGKDPGTGEVTLVLGQVLGVVGDYQYPESIRIDAFGRVIALKTGRKPLYEVNWNDVANKPVVYPVDEAQVGQAVNRWMALNSNSIKVSWANIEGKPTVYPVDPNDVNRLVNQWFANNTVSVDWSGIKNKPSYYPTRWADIQDKPDTFLVSMVWGDVKDKPRDLNGYGVLSEVQNLISQGVKAMAREEAMFIERSPADDELLHAKFFTLPAQLNFGGNKFAHAFTPPTATTTVDLYNSNTKIGSIAFNSSGDAAFSASGTVEFDPGAVLKAKLNGPANGIGKIAISLTLGYYEGTIVDPSPAPGNNTQHTITSVDGSYVWLYAPTDAATARLSTSLAYAVTAPTSLASFKVAKNGVEVGTLTFSANSHTGVFSGADVSLRRGDILGITCTASGNLGGLLVNVKTESDAPDELNLVAASATTITPTEIYRHVVAADFTIRVARSIAIAAQHDASKATKFFIRNNGSVVGEVNFLAGANDGVLTVRGDAAAFAAGSVLTIDAENASNLAGLVINLAVDVSGNNEPVSEFSASYVGDAPERQMVNGLLCRDVTALDFAHARAVLTTPAASAFTIVIHKNDVEICTVSFASGATAGTFSATGTVVVATGDRLVAYAKSGTATRPAITVPML